MSHKYTNNKTLPTKTNYKNTPTFFITNIRTRAFLYLLSSKQNINLAKLNNIIKFSIHFNKMLATLTQKPLSLDRGHVCMPTRERHRLRAIWCVIVPLYLIKKCILFIWSFGTKGIFGPSVRKVFHSVLYLEL